MKDLLPVLGVFLGWGLKELSDSVRGRLKGKETLKQTLYKLICLREDLAATFISNLFILKHLKEPFSHEEKRKNYQNQRINSKKIEEHIYEVENLMAGIEPFLTHEIISLMKVLKNFYELEFNEISKSKELYEESLKAHLVTLSLIYEKLGDILKKISKKISFKEYQKTKTYLEKRTSDKLYDSNYKLQDLLYPKGSKIFKKNQNLD